MIANPPLRRVEVMDAKPLPLTHADFMALAPEDRKAELINGELIIMPTPSIAHENLQVFLLTILRLFTAAFDLGRVFGSRTAVRIAVDQTYEPDILFVSRERQYIISAHEVREAPDLVIEILSATSAERDRGIKREHYETGGVRELWLIDPYGPAGTQFFQRQAERLIEVAPVNGIIYSTTLTNFQLKLAWLWPAEGADLPNPVTVSKELGIF
ncbi:MAG: Uma2 family endonuclease [Anaerolineales bacterium]